MKESTHREDLKIKAKFYRLSHNVVMQHFDCIWLVFFRWRGQLVKRDLIKHHALLWLVVFQQLWLVHFDPCCSLSDLLPWQSKGANFKKIQSWFEIETEMIASVYAQTMARPWPRLLPTFKAWLQSTCLFLFFFFSNAEGISTLWHVLKWQSWKIGSKEHFKLKMG